MLAPFKPKKNTKQDNSYGFELIPRTKQNQFVFICSYINGKEAGQAI
jgi:hypothetical protein